MPLPPASYVAPEIEAQVLAVLVSAETAREGVVGVLEALVPVIDDASAAIAVRDRDGMRLHVLAEIGAPVRWPERLAPQFAINAQAGVDPDTHVGVVPLRAHGTVVGALLLADARQASSFLRDENIAPLLDTVAAVLHTLVSRAEAEVRRRALTLRSVESVVLGMAHQMSNPLTGASAIAQLLIEELSDEGQRAAVRQMHDEMKRAFTVLNDLLDLQRDTMAQDGVIDLSAFAERILRFRAYAIREQGITLALETAPAYLPVRADARSLEHAMLLTLLCAEQRSHGTVNRSISVRVAEASEDEVAITIIDSSAGDVPEVSPAHFDLPLIAPERPARSVGDAPDLGLVDSILRACGGRLAVHGSKADGTSFSLILPRASSSPPT